MLGLSLLLSPVSAMSDEAISLNKYQPKPFVKVSHPEWVKNATIYEVNIRQYTKQGTFNAFTEHLPRLKEMGVDILWLMPIHPIGELNRKGEMGSYYAVKDYYGVNPQMGNLADLKDLVNQAHKMDMYVILDWVPNHTAWDNPLTKNHPEWYKLSKKGEFQSNPWWDWQDIIELDYQQPELRQYMTEALKYWVKEVNVDGYRVDTAGYVPTDFWNTARSELDKIKPVFMLAEAELRDLHEYAFDMAYSFRLHDVLHNVAHGHKDVSAIYSHFGKLENRWRLDMLRMNFVDNHDLNAWDKTMFERFGDFLHASIVLTATVEGMPLIYSGQEAELDKSLAFFDKDVIEWKTTKTGAIYQQLFGLKHRNTALWNGKWGSHMLPVANSNKKAIFSYTRANDADKVFVVLNFSNQVQKVTFNSTKRHLDKYTELFSGDKVIIKPDTELAIEPFGYRVYVVE